MLYNLPISVAVLLSPYLAHFVEARSCDGTQGTTAKSNPSVIQGTPQCPTNDGDTILTADGAYYSFQCCMHESSGSEFIKAVQTGGYDDCIDQCASTDGCQAFRYVYGDYKEETAGTCRLYRKGAFSSTKCGNTLHDWAYLTDPPVIEVEETPRKACSTECPDADGQVFHLDCQKRHGTAWFQKLEASSLKGCTDQCASYLGCQSVDFHKRTKKCYLGKRSSKPTLDTPGWATAYSLGCSGACKQDDCNSCSSVAPPNVAPLPAEEEEEPVMPADPVTPSDPITPAPPKEITCRDHNNKEVEVDGLKYQIRCEKQYRFSSPPITEGGSYEECLKICSSDAACKTVDYWDPNGSKSCYLFTIGANEEPTFETDMCWAAFKV